MFCGCFKNLVRARSTLIPEETLGLLLMSRHIVRFFFWGRWAISRNASLISAHFLGFIYFKLLKQLHSYTLLEVTLLKNPYCLMSTVGSYLKCSQGKQWGNPYSMVNFTFWTPNEISFARFRRFFCVCVYFYSALKQGNPLSILSLMFGVVILYCMTLISIYYPFRWRICVLHGVFQISRIAIKSGSSMVLLHNLDTRQQQPPLRLLILNLSVAENVVFVRQWKRLSAPSAKY